MSWYNPLTWFKKSNDAELVLYCQNPNCNNSLISNRDKKIAKIDDDLIHSECLRYYLGQKTFQSGKIGMVVIPNIHYISYSKAQKLARKRKVNFSKLELTE